MPGITRIKIVGSDWCDWRTQIAEAHAPVANEIYRAAFHLADGDETVKVTKQEALARYDYKEGIDVILTTVSGTRMTLQEKFLTFYDSTITFEERKTSGDQGAWYYCTAQYYFVGYTRKYWNYKTRRLFDEPVVAFQDFILVDLPAIHRTDEAGVISWQYNQNHFDGRGASFRYVNFTAVPESCVVMSAGDNQSSTVWKEYRYY